VVVDAVDLDQGVVRAKGVDLLDGTPILDIKPYMPTIDAWPEAGHGWLEPYLDQGIEPRLKKPFRPNKR
jgi:tRNA (Thr-GGU) A37 N-methylase